MLLTLSSGLTGAGVMRLNQCKSIWSCLVYLRAHCAWIECFLAESSSDLARQTIVRVGLLYKSRGQPCRCQPSSNKFCRLRKKYCRHLIKWATWPQSRGDHMDSQTALGLRTFVKPWAPEQTLESWWGPLATSQWPRPLARWVLEDGRWTNENLRIGWKWGISCQYNYQNLAINIFLNIVWQIWYVVDCWLSAWVNSR